MVCTDSCVRYIWFLILYGKNVKTFEKRREEKSARGTKYTNDTTATSNRETEINLCKCTMREIHIERIILNAVLTTNNRNPYGSRTYLYNILFYSLKKDMYTLIHAATIEIIRQHKTQK